MGMFAVLWLAIAVLVGLQLAISEPAGAPRGFGVFCFSGWVGIGVLLFTMIRWISRDDDIRLRRLIFEALEAEELAS